MAAAARGLGDEAPQHFARRAAAESVGRVQLDGVADGDRPSADNPRVKSELARESCADAEQDIDALLGCVRIEGRDDASVAQRMQADDYFADREGGSLPRSLIEAIHAAHDKVRPQPPAIFAERRDRSVGGDEKREDIEALGRVIAEQTRARSHLLESAMRLAVAPVPPG